LSIEKITEEDPTHLQALIHVIGTPLYQSFPCVNPATQLQAPLHQTPRFNSLLNSPQQIRPYTPLRSLAMIKSAITTQLVSSIMSESTKVAVTSMFITSLETPLYGGPSVPPGYQSLLGTFSSALTSPWTYPLPSSSGILFGLSLSNTPQPVLLVVGSKSNSKHKSSKIKLG